MDLLNFVKLSLRIQHNLFDEEIKTLIQSAKNILINSGLPFQIIEEANDEQLKNIISIYVKENLGRELIGEKFYTILNYNIQQLMYKYANYPQTTIYQLEKELTELKKKLKDIKKLEKNKIER
ncbi:phage gp6-like head-tail connector protein [Spiroplasma citri]|uniref:Phage gp6-like head-tail connector protein n=2 Tax=Spiroplasma TaxID=2132 RepID=A0AAQ3DJN0_SPICI|nr:MULTISPECIES: phage gp6-like head-tail connector protein [Spiroplasma]AXF95075.1 hypothetical protein SDAV_0059 [Spiroplasma phoeniceum P40]WFG95672.1 phage gp6-like head-tail connector protein [Spiroplasma citri]WFG96141.1 phage gp6-like head-tail connector protein [Spiroplasma citri]WFG97073.1 phage gp6-like head-tail connector protein [Spiroplasma citri]WFG99557.1 phage gp6-like head-tail connector protein [Spiroplasma citri]